MDRKWKALILSWVGSMLVVSCGLTNIFRTEKGPRSVGENDFTFQVPAETDDGGSLHADLLGGEVLYQGTAAKTWFSLVELPSAEGMDLDAYFHKFYQDFNRKHSVRPVDEGKRTFAGRDALQNTYDFAWGEPWYRRYDTWVVHNGRVIVASCETLRVEKPDRQICDAFFASFQIVGEPEPSATAVNELPAGTPENSAWIPVERDGFQFEVPSGVRAGEGFHDQFFNGVALYRGKGQEVWFYLVEKPLSAGDTFESLYQSVNADIREKTSCQLVAEEPLTVGGSYSVKRIYRYAWGEPWYLQTDIWINRGASAIIASCVYHPNATPIEPVEEACRHYFQTLTLP